MTISSRTPEGQPDRCPVCGVDLCVEPSTFPARDATCPSCGSLVWLSEEEPIRVSAESFETDLDVWRAAGRPLGSDRRLLIDFSEVRLFDSAALGRLMVAHRECSSVGGRLAVCGLTPEIREVFSLTLLDRLIEIREG